MTQRILIVAWFCALAGLAIAGISGCSKQETEAAAITEARAYVHVVPVGSGHLERTLELAGTVEAGRTVDLVPDVPGKVKELNVKVGDSVKEGQVLARVDLEVFNLQARQAAAAAQVATLGLETAEREYARAQALHNSGSLPSQQFEQAQVGLDMAKAQIEQAQAAQGLAQRQVRGGVLKAPFDGVVSWVACEVEQNFNPMAMSIGKPSGLVSVVDMRTIKIDIQVADRDIVRISQGMPARIFVDVLEDRLPPDGVIGTVEYAGKVADPVARTFPVRIRADNPGNVILIGTHARVLLVLEEKENTLWVPSKALGGEKQERYVMVVAQDKAARIAVKTGLEGDRGVEVLEGLTGDESVIVDGNFGLPDGAQVEVAQ